MSDDDAAKLAALGVVHVRADNPSPFTLTGTNTWIVGHDQAWVIDPGPALDDHLDAVAEAVARAGGAGGIALTHDHSDHTDGVAALRERIGPVPVVAKRFAGADTLIDDGAVAGPLVAVATPGHAPDHLAYLHGRVCFTGDAVLGAGSVFVWPDPGALSGYLNALRALRGRELAVLCPGHGPVVWDANDKLDEYVAHRLERESKLVAALERGLRSEDELLDAAWSDVPSHLRPAAGVVLRAHADKLAEEGRLPADVQLPRLPAMPSHVAP